MMGRPVCQVLELSGRLHVSFCTGSPGEPKVSTGESVPSSRAYVTGIGRR